MDDPSDEQMLTNKLSQLNLPIRTSNKSETEGYLPTKVLNLRQNLLIGDEGESIIIPQMSIAYDLKYLAAISCMEYLSRYIGERDYRQILEIINNAPSVNLGTPDNPKYVCAITIRRSKRNDLKPSFLYPREQGLYNFVLASANMQEYLKEISTLAVANKAIFIKIGLIPLYIKNSPIGKVLDYLNQSYKNQTPREVTYFINLNQYSKQKQMDSLFETTPLTNSVERIEIEFEKISLYSR